MAINTMYIAYRKGVDARANDEPFCNNPYDEKSHEWVQWREGWSDWDEHLDNNSEFA